MSCVVGFFDKTSQSLCGTDGEWKACVGFVNRALVPNSTARKICFGLDLAQVRVVFAGQAPRRWPGGQVAHNDIALEAFTQAVQGTMMGHLEQCDVVVLAMHVRWRRRPEEEKKPEFFSFFSFSMPITTHCRNLVSRRTGRQAKESRRKTEKDTLGAYF